MFFALLHHVKYISDMPIRNMSSYNIGIIQTPYMVDLRHRYTCFIQDMKKTDRKHSEEAFLSVLPNPMIYTGNCRIIPVCGMQRPFCQDVPTADPRFSGQSNEMIYTSVVYRAVAPYVSLLEKMQPQ